MRAFVLLALIPLALADTGSFVKISGFGQEYGYNHGSAHYQHPAPSTYHAQPAHKHEPAYKPHEPVYKPAPTYKPEPKYHPKPAPVYHPKPHHAPAYGHHAPAYGHHGYGYEEPKHNCTVQDVTEVAEVCTPTIVTTCENVDLPIKRIVDKEFCYTVTRTVCTESIEEIPQEICSYKYQKKYEDTTAKTVEVSFRKETQVQMVTVCQPGHQGYGHHRHHGYGYGGYGKYCKEVAQETAYNVPVVSPVDIAVKVAYPEPFKTCVNKPISLPRVSCEDLSEEKCIMVPEVMEDVETVEKCTAGLGPLACKKVELSLPKQRCVELVYGYAHEKAPVYGGHH